MEVVKAVIEWISDKHEQWNLTRTDSSAQQPVVFCRYMLSWRIKYITNTELRRTLQSIAYKQTNYPTRQNNISIRLCEDIQFLLEIAKI